MSTSGHGIYPWYSYPLVKELRQIEKKKTTHLDSQYIGDCDDSPRKVSARGDVCSDGQRQNRYVGTLEPVFKVGQIIYCKGSSDSERNLVFKASSGWKTKVSVRATGANQHLPWAPEELNAFLKWVYFFSGFTIMMRVYNSGVLFLNKRSGL